MTASNQNFPSSPLVDSTGRMTTSWRYFMNTLWNRSGGSSGGNGYFAYVNGDQTKTFSVAQAASSVEATPLAQVKSLVSGLLASPAFTGTPTAPTASAGTNTTQLATTAYALAAANTAQNNAETFATGQVRSLAGGSIASITVGASPFAYTAPSNGLVFIEGGTVTLQQFGRGSTTLTAGAPNSIVPVRDGDIVTVTYTAVPTMNFAPD